MPRVAARRILLLALGVGIVVDVTVPGNQAGLNAVVVMVALLGAACRGGRPRRPAALRPRRRVAARGGDLARGDGGDPRRLVAGRRPTSCSRPRSPAARSPPSPARGSPAASCPASSTPPAAVVAAAAHGRDRGGAGRRGPRPASSPRRRPTTDARSVTASGRGSPSYRGLLIATPILLVFALLFASADAVFAGLVRDALHLPISIDLEDLTGRAVVVLVVAWAAAGLFALGAGRLPLLIPGPSTSPVPPARSLGAASAADLARRSRSAGLDRGGHRPRRRRRAVRRVRRPPARLPVRRARHARGRRDDLRRLRPARVLRAGRGRRARRDAGRRASTSPCAGARGRSSPRASRCSR